MREIERAFTTQQRKPALTPLGFRRFIPLTGLRENRSFTMLESWDKCGERSGSANTAAEGELLRCSARLESLPATVPRRRRMTMIDGS
jgi:hypothetical protein